MGMEEYKLEAHPVSKKEAIIQGDCYRITMLTSALVRLEYNSEGVFEDRATQSVLTRDFPDGAFQIKKTFNPNIWNIVSKSYQIARRRKICSIQ